MGDFVDAKDAVQGVLDDLRKVLHVRDMRENGGLRADTAELRQKWSRLEEALRKSADVMQKPQPGQGLVSIWLRAVCEKAAKVEEAAKRHSNGWHDVLWHDDGNLFWLAIDAWESGYKVSEWSVGQGRGLASLLEPELRPLERLRDLADEWSTEFENAPEEPQGFVLQEVLNRWIPWQNRRDEYVRQAGKLILEAIDALEIPAEFLENNDFCDRVLKYMTTPAGFVRPYLREVSGEGLLELVDRLESPRTDVRDIDQTGSYPTPKNYARDKWVYENVHLHDCQTLSKMLEKECRRNHWKTLTSRNGLKIAADRYAGFSRLPPHRFPDDRVVS